MLMPKRTKYRKQMRGRMTGNAKGGASVSFGEYGLKALEPCWMTNRQIESRPFAPGSTPSEIRKTAARI